MNNAHAVHRSLESSCDRKIPLLPITPGDVGDNLGSLSLATLTKKLRRAALRPVSDVLVVGHVVSPNPADLVRARR